ncbi:MAG: energy-coupling factor ABC transporter permease [Gammaproteobacteria bacterium]|nr:energy-coupling factor ABC transporter permease [Gammaproteobacteria bacterium]MDH5653820.1 energy-coupling factor ABC transporter permease [Gammaproteobacteria bacterium]
MHTNPYLFSNFWFILGAAGYGWILVQAARHAAWRRLRNSADLNVLLYTMLGVFCIWLMNTDYENSRTLVGPTLHLLGATLMTMMFGWAFAILAMSLVLIAYTITAGFTVDTWYSLPLDGLATGVLPILISYRLFHFADKRLPNNFFIYIFVCAFFGAALSMAGVVFTTAGLHYLSGAYRMEKLASGYIPFGLLLVFPEAFLTGALMSIFVVYQPEWVSTFDDRRYLRKR